MVYKSYTYLSYRRSCNTTSVEQCIDFMMYHFINNITKFFNRKFVAIQNYKKQLTRIIPYCCT